MIPTLVIALYHRLRAWNLRIFVVSNLLRVNISMMYQMDGTVRSRRRAQYSILMKDIVRVFGHLL